MSQLAYTRRAIVRKQVAPVIPIHFGKKVESSKQHGKGAHETAAKKEIPLFYNRPIFKAKDHDPL